MRRFTLNKLVRDKVYDNMLALGQKVERRDVQTKREFIIALMSKLCEEVLEFEPDSPNALDELVDILEPVELLTELLGSNFNELRARQLERREKAGSFTRMIYVETVTLADDDEWVQYYASERGRFPEVKEEM